MIIKTAAKVAPPIPRSLTTFSLTFPPRSVGFHEWSGAAQPELILAQQSQSGDYFDQEGGG